MEIRTNGETAQIFTPYNAEFVSAIKGIGGAKWNRYEQCWEIPESAVEACREIMMRVYGECDIPSGEKVKVRLTFTKDFISDTRQDIVLMGKTVAHAWGRDSGARPGDDAVFVAGKAKSGGSMKNWHTCIEEGSVVELHNVPAAAYEKFMSGAVDGVTAEIISNETNVETLIAERKRLIARLAEINAILGGEE